MDINEQITEIKKNIKLIGLLEKNYDMRSNPDVNEPLTYCGVTNSDLISKITPIVEEYFGKPFKTAGDSAFFLNMFDKFIKRVGGIRKEQTLYKKEITEKVILYCAFWPWGSDTIKTSIRIGLVCFDKEEEKQFIDYLKLFFK